MLIILIFEWSPESKLQEQLHTPPQFALSSESWRSCWSPAACKRSCNTIMIYWCSLVSTTWLCSCPPLPGWHTYQRCVFSTMLDYSSDSCVLRWFYWMILDQDTGVTLMRIKWLYLWVWWVVMARWSLFEGSNQRSGAEEENKKQEVSCEQNNGESFSPVCLNKQDYIISINAMRAMKEMHNIYLKRF